MSKKNCRIAVIGGGLSGLVLAEGLQRKGYEKVTLFEKDVRLGKLYTIWYDDKSVVSHIWPATYKTYCLDG